MRRTNARMLLDGARRNPIALGLIATGAIWLISDKDSKIPSLGSGSDGSDSDAAYQPDNHHRDYVSHMSSVEQRPDEDATAYQRRRDTARSNFLMVERDQEEDDSSFRERLNGMTDNFRETRHAWAESSLQAQAATQAESSGRGGQGPKPLRGQSASGRHSRRCVWRCFWVGSADHRARAGYVGAAGRKGNDLVDEQTKQVTAQVREKKDELLDKADAALQKPAVPSPGPGTSDGNGQDHKAEQSRQFS